LTLRKIILVSFLAFILSGFVSIPGFCSTIGNHDNRNPENVINMNVASALVRGATFHRFHIPINYERVIKPNRSIVFGFHSAISLDSHYSGFAFGTSFRMRYFKKTRAPVGFWLEWGVLAFYQEQKGSKKKQSQLIKTYGDSYLGVLSDVGYKWFLSSRRHLVLEPFIGIALPVISISDERTRLFNTPFPWAGLSLGYAF
jgi:hypothetical protein